MPSPGVPIRTAVIGFGLAGRVFHCPFLSAVPGLELAAIVQRSGDEAAAAYPGAAILRSAEEAIADPAIDLIVVGTPNPTHFPLAAAALRAGKHVVVDKPFAATSAEAHELIDLAAMRGLVLAPFHNRRFDGDFRTLKQLFAAQTLGRVTQVSSHFDRFRPVPKAHSWKEDEGPASGLLFDIGTHLLDQALALFGSPERITADVRTERESTSVIDAFDIVLDYRVGDHPLRYGCHASLIVAEPAPRFVVHGTRGSFTKFGLDLQEPTVLKGGRPPVMGSSSEMQNPWLVEPESAWGILTRDAGEPGSPKLERSDVPTMAGDYRLFYASVRDAIRGDAALAVPAAAGSRSIQLIELAMQSSEQGCSLPVRFDT